MNSHEDFRNVIRSEREDLTRLSDYWNSQVKCNQSIPKDFQGRIRAAVGKTRLLLSEKFKQFEGLIDQSENNTAEKEISINDLQGFWDLVLIQVNEVKEMFRGLDFLNERIASDRKMGSNKTRETEVPQKETTKEVKNTGSISRKKPSSDYLDQTEKKLKEIIEKDKGRVDSNLRHKMSLSKLSKS